MFEGIRVWLIIANQKFSGSNSVDSSELLT